MRNSEPLLAFVERHRALDGAVASEGGKFMSDWNGTHPFVSEFLRDFDLNHVSRLPGHMSRYAYFDDTREIADGIRDFHAIADGIAVERKGVIAGPGSSSILAAFALWLLQRGYNDVCYLPPLYFTFHYLLRTLSIRVRPVSGKHPFEPDAVINLPERRSVLLLTDPIWFAGRRLAAAQIEQIAAWQSRTGSAVFVDGSFQYTQWDGSRAEHSAQFDPDLTFRLVCPTKALAIPAFRFAYLLLPAKYHDDFLFLYESILGSSNFTDLEFARRALAVLSSPRSNRPLTEFFRDTHDGLLREKFIEPGITPDCGYFAFVLPTKRLPGRVFMTQDHFELKRHPRHVRINLMVAAPLLSGPSHVGAAQQKRKTRKCLIEQRKKP